MLILAWDRIQLCDSPWGTTLILWYLVHLTYSKIHELVYGDEYVTKILKYTKTLVHRVIVNIADMKSVFKDNTDAIHVCGMTIWEQINEVWYS